MPEDFDICTSLLPAQIENIFKEYNPVPLGARFGTFRIENQDQKIDISTFRAESGYSDYRHPDFVSYTSDVIIDLSRRDFTVNAIALTVFPELQIVDPFDGRNDLKNKILRTVGNPYERFSEDPLRLMRCIRFACKLDFSIEDITFSALIESAGLISNISSERIRDELIMILLSDRVQYGIEILCNSNILFFILPRFSNIALFKDKLKLLRNVKTMFQGENDLYSRILALIFVLIPCDSCYIDKFMQEISILTLKDLRFDNKMIKNISEILRKLDLSCRSFDEEQLRIKRVIYEIGFKNTKLLLEIEYKLSEAYHSENLIPVEQTSKALEVLNLVKNHPISLAQLEINGSDLITEGFCSANDKKIGMYLKQAVDLVHSDPLQNNKIHLLAKLRKLNL